MIKLFQLIHNNSDHFFLVRADIFKCHPDSSLVRAGNLSSELERLVEALQFKGHYNLIAHYQRTPGSDKQPVCTNIGYFIGINMVIRSEVDRNIA